MAVDDIVRQGLSRLEFADEILRAAASPERIGTVLTGILRDRLTVGPMPFGPGGLMSVHAVGRMQDATVESDVRDHTRLTVHLPMVLRVDVHVGGMCAKFLAGVCIRVLIALALDRPCALLVQPAPVSPADVTVRIHGVNTLARWASRTGVVSPLLAAEVAAHANTILEDPTLTAVSRIDVLDLIDRAWSSGLILDRFSA
ncbi:hypothetical protein D7D52_14025 [Nocardia yunnanensis]|uniref:Uncharacterized protein n=2 Tax=Nocardia yunnanensis TaxID=2382165 RepID=A0A386ZB43_9NOCA|nr:hypothetical protein D7D52_14025 [Nocardia yunnanensis]